MNRTRYGLVALIVVCVMTVGMLGLGVMPLQAPTAGTWSPTPGSLAEARAGAASSLLADGRVLITGGKGSAGALSAAEFMNADGTFSAAPSMQFARYGHTSTVLPDGNILVAGGTGGDASPTDTAEVYDPLANEWYNAAHLMVPRSGHTATILADGRILIAGGASSGGPTASLEIFDPSGETFGLAASSLSTPRQNHAAALLADGRVLILGGSDGTKSLATSEIFDPSNGSTSPGPVMSVARSGLTGTKLLDGSVLVAGGSVIAADGSSQDLASAEIMDAAAGAFAPAPSGMAAPRSGHLAILLPNNNAVLIVGGASNGTAQSSAELYMPWTGAFSPTGAMSTSRSAATSSTLASGGILVVAGGSDGANSLASSEAYGFATVKTDQSDYPPGTVVNISGSGWQPNETVQLNLVENPDVDADSPIIINTTADASGNISDRSFATDINDLNIRITLTAVGAVSQAQTTFTDAGPKPTTTITSPAGGGSYNSAAWPGTIAGGSTFASGTSGRAVNVSIKRNGSTNKYWNGSAFSSSAEVVFGASLNGGQTAWTLAFPSGNFTADDSYTVHSQAVDSNGTEAGSTTATFTIDNSAPAMPVVTGLAAGSDLGSSTHDGITSATTNLNFNGTAEKNTTVNLFVDGSVSSAGSGNANNSGAWNNIAAGGSLAEGNHNIRATATDAAGNVSPLSDPFTITIDTTPPTLGLSPASGTVSTPFSFSWNITDPTSSLVSSGVNAGTCSISVTGSATFTSTTCSGSHSLAAGTYTVSASASDVAGNTGTDSRTYTVISDTTPPVITPHITGTLGNNGWYTSNVDVSFTVADPDSTVTARSASCLLDSTTTTISTDTTDTAVTCTATSAGGTASNTVHIKRDSTPPSYGSGALTPAANGNGWNNTNVTANFPCTDATSGAVTNPVPVLLTTEGAGQTATALSTNCVDNAGNHAAANATLPGINIDKTKPVIAGSPSPAANGNGWNNSDVVVAFTCTDSLSTVDVNTVAGATLSAEGTGQSVTNTGTCTDKAGNSADPATVNGINIDKTAPTLAFDLQNPVPNVNGWDNTNVSFSYTPGDALSGVDSASPLSPLVLSAEGSAVTGEVTVTDKAGNSKTFTSPAVKIDKTAPSITGSRLPLANANGWNNTDVTVSFACSDGLSGMAAGSPPADTTLSTEGSGQSVSKTCFDLAGNSASDTVSGINIDKTAPNAPTAVHTPAANGNGWNNSDVTVSFTSNGDAGLVQSGVDTCTGSTVYSTETSGTAANGTCTDKAGNISTESSTTVKIDKTKPVITAHRSVPPNANGWNNTNVEVTFTCADSLSGVDTNTLAGATLTAEGAGQSVTNTGTCKDAAGNEADAVTESGINIDKTPPTISASRTPLANVNGWNNVDVTANYTASDALSDLDLVFAPATGSHLFNTEGENQSHTFTVQDKAGNQASATIDHVNIDKTLPLITGHRTPAPNAYGWNNVNVDVSFTCADNGAVQSGIAMNTVAGTTVSTEGAGQSVTNTGNCTDKADNSAASATVSDINIDKTAPSISASRSPAPNAFGWNNTDVLASYSASDSLSGLVSSATGNFNFSSEGASQSHTFTVTDKADNTASATISDVNIDKTAPALNPTVTPNPVTLNGSATASSGASDSLSGINTQSCGALLLNSVGPKNVSCTATDKAGNTNTASAAYSVQYASFGTACLGDLGHSILQPINLDGSSVFKQKSTVPTKLRVCDANGMSIGTPGVVLSYRVVGAFIGTVATTYTEDPVSTTPDSAFRWDPTAQQWIFNTNTKGLTANVTYAYQIALNDGTFINFQWGLK